MKRPFAAIGFTAFTVMLLLAFCERTALAYFVIFLCAVTGVLSLFKKRSRQAMTLPVCMLTAVTACLLFLNFSLDKEHAQGFTGENISVEAVVAEAPYMNDYSGYYCVLKLTAIENEEVRGRMRISFSPSADNIDLEALSIGDKVSFTAVTYLPGKAAKSMQRYFTSEKIHLGAYGIKNLTVYPSQQKSIAFYFHSLRAYITRTLRYAFADGTAGLLVGMLTGDKSCLDKELYDAFKSTGAAHLMAVSGLHLTLWVFSLGSLIPDTGRASRLKYILLIIAVIFIMLLAGMSPSVSRAGFMALVLLSGKLSGRRSDSLNSLGIAVTVMLICNPMCVMSVSFLLSFTATLGIITLGTRYIKKSEKLHNRLSAPMPVKKLLKYCTDIFFISISVTVFTFPVVIYAFGGISTVSAWVNILISPFVAPLLILTGVFVLIANPVFIAVPVAAIIKGLSGYIIFIIASFSRLANAFLSFEKENIFLFIAAIMLITALSLVILGDKLKYKSLTAALLCTLSLVLILH